MKDRDVKLSMQEAAAIVEKIFPGRAFTIVVFNSTPDERTHYTSNALRGQVLEGLKSLIDQPGALDGLPADYTQS